MYMTNPETTINHLVIGLYICTYISFNLLPKGFPGSTHLL